LDFAALHPYVYYATQYPFSKQQTSKNRICYASSLYLISNGYGTLKTGGRTYNAGPGSLVYIPAGQPHEWIADSVNPMIHICCYFDWHYIDRKDMFDNASSICYDFSKLKRSLIGPQFLLPIPEYLKVEHLRVWIDLFESFYTTNEYTNELTFIRSLTIQRNFQTFIEHFLSHVLQEKIPDPRIYRLLEKMEQDLMQGNMKPVDIYCDELNLSRGYFFELFKRATGLSPTQYMNHFRINRTKEDLRFSNLSITEIAEKHYFSSVHYFSRLFRQITGQTPRKYREMEASMPGTTSQDIDS